MPEVDEQPRFSEDELAAERALSRSLAGSSQPSLTDLRKALKRFGPEGIMESARHLDEAQYDSLAAEVRAATPAKRRKMRLGI